jgi:hypothetical protein
VTVPTNDSTPVVPRDKIEDKHDEAKKEKHRQNDEAKKEKPRQNDGAKKEKHRHNDEAKNEKHRRHREQQVPVEARYQKVEPSSDTASNKCRSRRNAIRKIEALTASAGVTANTNAEIPMRDGLLRSHCCSTRALAGDRPNCAGRRLTKLEKNAERCCRRTARAPFRGSRHVPL